MIKHPDEESGKVVASHDRVMIEQGSHDDDDDVIPNSDDIVIYQLNWLFHMTRNTHK